MQISLFLCYIQTPQISPYTDHLLKLFVSWKCLPQGTGNTSVAENRHPKASSILMGCQWKRETIMEGVWFRSTDSILTMPPLLFQHRSQFHAKRNCQKKSEKHPSRHLEQQHENIFRVYVMCTRTHLLCHLGLSGLIKPTSGSPDWAELICHASVPCSYEHLYFFWEK